MQPIAFGEIRRDFCGIKLHSIYDWTIYLICLKKTELNVLFIGHFSKSGLCN